MRQSTHASSTDTASSIAAAITALLPRFHVLVIGPGLGRDPLMQDVCARVIVSAKASHMPFVLDADGLLLAQTRPELVQGYRECILTPNLAEFARLCMAQGLDPLKFAPETGEGAEALARKLGGVTVVQKGRRDWISNGELTVLNDVEGGFKRSGGQGDTLTGSLATFLAWRKAYLDGIWEHDGSLDKWELLALAAFGGSAITRVSFFFSGCFVAGPSVGIVNVRTQAFIHWTGALVITSPALTFRSPASIMQPRTNSSLGMLPPRLCQAGPQPAGQRSDGGSSRCVPESV
jgi:ATP-dependent NAD(P)H-hydrate dehydratase